MMDSVPHVQGGHACQTCMAFAQLDGDDAAALSEWLADRSISARRIRQALSAYGIEVGQSSVQRHRREHLGTMISG